MQGATVQEAAHLYSGVDALWKILFGSHIHVGEREVVFTALLPLPLTSSDSSRTLLEQLLSPGNPLCRTNSSVVAVTLLEPPVTSISSAPWGWCHLLHCCQAPATNLHIH
jgi:hypothetical protein